MYIKIQCTILIPTHYIYILNTYVQTTNNIISHTSTHNIAIYIDCLYMIYLAVSGQSRKFCQRVRGREDSNTLPSRRTVAYTIPAVFMDPLARVTREGVRETAHRPERRDRSRVYCNS